jgi:hypothetical protein
VLNSPICNINISIYTNLNQQSNLLSIMEQHISEVTDVTEVTDITEVTEEHVHGEHCSHGPLGPQGEPGLHGHGSDSYPQGVRMLSDDANNQQQMDPNFLKKMKFYQKQMEMMEEQKKKKEKQRPKHEGNFQDRQARLRKVLEDRKNKKSNIKK